VRRQAAELAMADSAAEEDVKDLEIPEATTAGRDAVARAMELLEGLANEQVPAAKAAFEQRRQARASAATVDGGDAGDELPSEAPTRTPRMTGTMTRVSRVTNGRRWDSSRTRMRSRTCRQLTYRRDSMTCQWRSANALRASLSRDTRTGCTRTHELRSPEHMQRATERQLRMRSTGT
jgi:hypothetical protein